MQPIEVVISVLSLVAVGLLWRYFNLLEKRRDERHNEMVAIQRDSAAQMNRLNESVQREMAALREESSRNFRLRDEENAKNFRQRDDKLAEDFRIRDKHISDNRHQIKNLTANMMMVMAKEYPDFVKYMEKFMKND